MSTDPMETDPFAAEFYAAAELGDLVVQMCDSCATLRHYPRHRCPKCLSASWHWTKLAGTGYVYTYTITHRKFGSIPDVPHGVMTVQLDEGIKVVSDIPAEQLDSVEIGSRCTVYFSPLQGVVRPRFRLTE
jgi:hypothetical protein